MPQCRWAVPLQFSYLFPGNNYRNSSGPSLYTTSAQCTWTTANLARRVTWARPWSRHREPPGLGCFTGETKMTPWPVGRARHAHKENVPPRSHSITGERDKTKQAHQNPSRICYFLCLFYYFFFNHVLRVSFCRLSRRREWLCHFKKTQGEGPRL